MAFESHVLQLIACHHFFFCVLFCKLILSCLKKFLSECMSKFEDDQFTNTRELHSTSRCTVKYWFNLWFWYWVFFFSLNVYITNNYFKDTVVLPKLTGATNEQLVAAQWVFVPFTFLKTVWCLGKNYIIILINHQYGNGFFIFIDKVLKFTAKDKRIFLK